MASTNKTTNYELSQYVGSDKPTYLGDYNSDMLKIDTAMKTNADNISTASSTATTANSTANTANETATTANSTANTALAKATQNEADIAKFNLTNTTEIPTNTITTNYGTVSTGSSIRMVTNSDGSIFKLYGRIVVSNTSGGSVPLQISFASSLRPTESINILSGGMCFCQSKGYVTRTIPGGGTEQTYDIQSANEASINIATNGVITITASEGYRSQYIYLPPCLYFLENFGD